MIHGAPSWQTWKQTWSIAFRNVKPPNPMLNCTLLWGLNHNHNVQATTCQSVASVDFEHVFANLTAGAQANPATLQAHKFAFGLLSRWDSCR